MLSAATRGLRLLPAETAHRITLRLVETFVPLLAKSAPDDATLAVSALGLKFGNPIGLAAGFDKDADVPSQMLRLGLGFVECGTVTPKPQPGNPGPRLFRLTAAGAVINRMGFNSRGMEYASAKLAAREQNGIVGINIGANKESKDRISDYRLGFEALSPLADYATVNVSSPNTPGLRGLQNRDELERLLAMLVETRQKLSRRVPILLKIAPDLDEDALDDIARCCLDAKIDGLVISNTTVGRPAGLPPRLARESGGLSGTPLFALSTEKLRNMRRRVGDRLVLIGVGGVDSGARAYEKIRAGASLVQLYTALAFQGPDLIARIKRELLACLARDGFADIASVVGVDAR